MEKNKQPPPLAYFKAITDILIISIRNNDSNLVYTVSQFFTDQFLRFRHGYMENDSSDPLDYPDEYYFMVRRTVEEIAKNKNPKFSGVGIAGNSAGSIWFLGNFDKIEIPVDDKMLFIWMISFQNNSQAKAGPVP